MPEPEANAAAPEGKRRGTTRREILAALGDLRNTVRNNVFAGRREICSDGRWQAWTDADDAAVRELLESNYGISSDAKVADALTILFEQRAVDPLVEMLDSLPPWDGVERIRCFFPQLVHCPDLPIYAEYARMLFAGGVNRAYEPGCKFDELLILADGPQGHQGGGKSTLVRLLNMQDEYFHTVDTIEGQAGMEALQMLWIGELAELAGLKTVKGQEQAKNFLSRTHDHYREPYARYAQRRPRRCVLIGTSNDSQFLTDRTGNRRYLPVECNLAEGEIDRRENEARDLIARCWQEAVTRYKRGDPYMTRCRMRPEYYSQSAELQQVAMETDWREGMIRAYLDGQPVGYCTCVAEVYEHALHMSLADRPPDPKASREIGQLIRAVPGWEPESKSRRFSKYGVQKSYRKISGNTNTEPAEIRVDPPADLPF